MHDSNLVRVLGRQSRHKVGLVDLATAVRGPDAIRKRVADLSGEGHHSAIVDAVFDHELEAIGQAALDYDLSVGASGMGLGLARGLISSGKVKDASTSAIESKPIGGPVACLAGSCSQATLTQIKEAEKTMAVLRLDPEQIVKGGSEIQRALDWATDNLSKSPILIASSSTPDQVSALQSRHGRDVAGHAIEQAMADISEGLMSLNVRRLIVAGGETSGAVVDRLAIPAFLVGPEIATGVPVLRTISAKRGDMIMALKSGNFGGPDFFNDAVRLVT
jgi:uncharacterized protein YgbK (DUF1537 family)